ncbi:hypothetical protein SESBI_10173 [Sesbania bispinosa]|nr:hypothetical protein SESBI_10173 [Sesbania bispinosa]
MNKIVRDEESKTDPNPNKWNHFHIVLRKYNYPSHGDDSAREIELALSLEETPVFLGINDHGKRPIGQNDVVGRKGRDDIDVIMDGDKMEWGWVLWKGRRGMVGYRGCGEDGVGFHFRGGVGELEGWEKW